MYFVFPQISLSDFQDVVNIFRPNTRCLKKSGKDSRNSTEEKAELESSDFISTLELLQSSNSPDYIVLKDESIINNG